MSSRKGSGITEEYSITCLLQFIEEMRRELNHLGVEKPLTDPEVVRLSQRLDILLNQYQNQQYEQSYKTIGA
ncbi:aspartyl-phosphate phosphatase Spo0E family protein [Desulfitobacterium metallireducens]|uniref:Sporulation protein Spo0E n=1 Tax=Desulfitobacterium metallireducens DSM 15288 TaxID=871968 RepID=W0EE59_9FIRM|nr:aspartyl-phosphate phosphatase Spo0E family protein [Desulfitobacterium metallireducens]AHF07494.1 sporulation protein Spo0E [Desulfitobacterium metallireducens DSM 15288]